MRTRIILAIDHAGHCANRQLMLKRRAPLSIPGIHLASQPARRSDLISPSHPTILSEQKANRTFIHIPAP